MNLADDGAQALNTIPSSDHEYRYIVLQSILACELKCMASSRGSQLYFSLEVPCFGAYLWLPTQLIMWRVFSLSLFVVITVDGWCYRCILCFMVGCHILLFLWNMNWGIEIMALIVVFLTRLCFTYNWIWINVCTLDNPLFMRDPMCCEFIGG